MFFANLRSLSLANNCIASLTALTPLSSLPYLEAVTLEGNPIEALPNYREHVLVLLKKIKQLDGKAVDDRHRQDAAAVCVAEMAVTDLALYAGLLLFVLQHASKWRSIHNELRCRQSWQQQEHEGGRQTTALARTILASYSPDDSLVSDLHQSFLKSATRYHDKIILRCSSSSGIATTTTPGAAHWHTALCKALADIAAGVEAAAEGSIPGDQNGKSTWGRACLLLRQKFHELSSFRELNCMEERCADMKRFYHEALAGSIESSIGIGIGTGDSGSFTKCTNSTTVEEEWSIPAMPSPRKQGKMTDKEQEHTTQQQQQQQEKKETAKQKSMETAAQNVVLSEENSWLKLALQQAEERVAVAEAQVQAVCLDKEETETAAQRVLLQEQSALQEAVEKLRGWLEIANEKIEEEKRGRAVVAGEAAEAAAVFARAKESLEQRVGGLEKKIEIVDKENGVVRVANAMLEGQIAGLRQHLDDAHKCVAEEREKNKILREKAAAAAVVVVEEKQPIKLDIKVYFAEELERERANVVALAAAVEAARSRATHAETKVASLSKEIENRDAQMAKRAERKRTLLALLEGAEERVEARIKRGGFDAWRVGVGRRRAMRTLETGRNDRILKVCLHHWQREARCATLLRSLCATAQQMRQCCVLNKSIRAWRYVTDVYRQIDTIDERSVANLRREHHRRRLQQAFVEWRRYVDSQTAMQKANVLVFKTQNREAKVLYECFTGWHRAVAAQRCEEEEDGRGRAARALVLSRIVLRMWRGYTLRAMTTHSCAEASLLLHRQSLARRTLQAWAWAVQQQQHQRDIVLSALLNENTKLCRAGLAAWRRYVDKQKHDRLVELLTCRCRTKMTLHKVVTSWRYVVRCRRYEDAVAVLEATHKEAICCAELAARQHDETMTALSAQIDGLTMELQTSTEEYARQYTEKVEELEAVKAEFTEQHAQYMQRHEEIVASLNAQVVSLQNDLHEARDAFDVLAQQLVVLRGACQQAESRCEEYQQHIDEHALRLEEYAMKLEEEMEARAQAEALCSEAVNAMEAAFQGEVLAQQRLEEVGAVEERVREVYREDMEGMEARLKAAETAWREAEEERGVAVRQCNRFAYMMECNVMGDSSSHS